MYTKSIMSKLEDSTLDSRRLRLEDDFELLRCMLL